MSWWSGKYSDTDESKEPLEKDIERAMGGWIRKESEGGGTVDERVYLDDGVRIDAYAPSNSPKGHSHDRYTSRNGKSHYEHIHD